VSAIRVLLAAPCGVPGNFVAALSLVFFFGRREFRKGAADLAAAWLVYFLVVAGTHALYVGRIGPLSLWGSVVALATSFLLVAPIYSAAVLARLGEHARVLVIALLYALMIGAGLVLMVWLVAEEPADRALTYLYLGLGFGPPAISLLRTARLVPGAPLWTGAVVAGAFCVAEALMMAGLPQAPLFETAIREDPAADERYRPVDVEELYHAQPGLMEAALRDLAPSDPGRPELYAILGAGTADQGVFLREVAAGAAILAERFDARGRIIALANSQANPLRQPLLSPRNLAAALAGLAARMGPEDVALLYLTSHGAPESFSFGFWEAGLTSLSADQLAAMLYASGIGNLVVVVSACYSGSFVPKLAGPDRLVVTAAAADRTSFGCADENEWTNFGRAFFVEGLGRTTDLARAAEIARERVVEWETRDGRKPSEPQIAMGAGIAPRLAALSETRPIRASHVAE
jgi:hypothetical protein